MTEFSAADAGHLRATLAEAHALAIAGRFPFTARLVDVTGAVVATAANGCDASGDPTAHAEVVLLRRASAMVSRGDLSSMTMYAAAEPCAMCTAAIVWSGVGRLVYGLSAASVCRAPNQRLLLLLRGGRTPHDYLT